MTVTPNESERLAARPIDNLVGYERYLVARPLLARPEPLDRVRRRRSRSRQNGRGARHNHQYREDPEFRVLVAKAREIRVSQPV